MPVKINIQNPRFFNQLKNGENFDLNLSDFTTNLVGNVGEKVKAFFETRVEWYGVAGLGDEWVFLGNSITRSTGSFAADGFTDILGLFEYYSDWNQRDSTPDFTAQIDFISSDGLTIEFTPLSGTVPTGGTTSTDAGIWAVPSNGSNIFNGCVFRFGLASNQESNTFNSKVSLNEQEYYTNVIDRTIAFQNPLQPKGTFRDWQSGSATLALKVENNPKNNDIYEVEHIFEILPDFLVGELANLQNKQVVDLLANSNTLDYVAELEFRRDLTNTDAPKNGNALRVLGNVGWFEENFNGIEDNYSLSMFSYGSASSLDLENPTSVFFQINKDSGNIAAGTRIGLYFSYLPNDESEYQDLPTTIQENFEKDSLFHTEGNAASVGLGIIKSLECTELSGLLQVEAVLEFDSTQQARFSNSDYYRLSVQIEDGGLNAVNSDRVHKLVDVEQFNYDNGPTATQLINWTKFNYLNHLEELGVDVGATEINTWNEDGILLDFEFTLDTNSEALLNDIEFNLVAYDGSNYFLLDRTPINLSNIVISAGVQQIEIDTTRGYQLNAADQFNFVLVETGANSSGIVTYSGAFAQKIKWQDWLNNIAVDPVFYDNNEPNNNLNFKSSNYSAVNGYSIRLIAKTNVTGIDNLNKPINQDSENIGGEIRTYDYLVSDDGSFTNAVIQTLDPDTLTDLGGKVRSDKNTLMKVTWDSTPEFEEADIRYIIHRIQLENSAGDDIEESSTARGALDGGILQDVTFSKVGSQIISESLIDFTKLEANRCYNLSARIQALEPIVLDYKNPFCETLPQVFTPPPVVPIPPDPPPIEPPKKPAICGQNLGASGGAGIFDYLIEVNYNGYLAYRLQPYDIPDKAEFFEQPRDSNKNIIYSALPPTILATTHMDNIDPSIGVATNSGLGQQGGNLNPLPYEEVIGQPYLRRRLFEDAAGAGVLQNGSDSDVQYVGNAKGSPYPATNRRQAYIDETGDVNPPSIFGSSADKIQYLWIPVQAGRAYTLRLSGQGGTASDGITFCHIPD